MDQLVRKIISQKISCYFISPHLDDGMLSAGGLIASLAGKTDVTLVTLFTAADTGPYTFMTRRFLAKCGYNNAQDLFEARREEDKTIADKLGISCKHLGFTDGAWRKRNPRNILEMFLRPVFPELIHLYPLSTTVSRPAKEDHELLDTIKERLKKELSDKKAIIFAPMATGMHIDHLLTHMACHDVFPQAIYWNDSPYLFQFDYSHSFIAENNLQQFEWNGNLEKKEKLLELYVSQIKGLAKVASLKKICSVKETFFVPNNF